MAALHSKPSACVTPVSMQHGSGLHSHTLAGFLFTPKAAHEGCALLKLKHPGFVAVIVLIRRQSQIL